MSEELTDDNVPSAKDNDVQEAVINDTLPPKELLQSDISSFDNKPAEEPTKSAPEMKDDDLSEKLGKHDDLGPENKLQTNPDDSS